MKPTLFLGGAPKCGTSAFFDILAQTEHFEASKPKETFYFMDSDHCLLNKKHNYWNEGFEGFQRFFSNLDSNKILLEGSTHLLFQETIPNLLKEENTKFIFILREPASRIFSSFQYSKNNLARFTKEIDFAEYVNILLEGREAELDNFIKPSATRDILKKELTMSNYKLHLDKWGSAIGRDRFKIVLYDDFKKNSNKEVAKAIAWLGLKPISVELENEQKNKTRAIKNLGIHRLLVPLNKYVPGGEIKKIVKRIYFGFQSKELDSKLDDKKTLEDLRLYFNGANEALAKSYNLDLESWS